MAKRRYDCNDFHVLLKLPILTVSEYLPIKFDVHTLKQKYSAARDEDVNWRSRH